MMRLKQNDIDIIKSTLLSTISDAKIFLFGSRTDDSKRGGDIDIFVKTKENISLKDELSILSKLELSGITRKIDLVIQTPYKNHRDFFQSIKKEAIAL